MKQGQRLLPAAAIVCSLILAVSTMLGQASPARAAGPPWTKYSGEVNLENELYVTDAWVLRDDNTYRMWYTHLKTDLNLVEILDEMSALHLDDIIYDLADLDLDTLLNDLAALKDTYDNVADIVDFLDSTGTVIGYATSSNGINWTIVEPEALAGDSNALWDNVGTPCVINDGGTYQMWYTRDRIDLTQTQLENILSDLNEGDAARKDALEELLGSISTVISYAESPDGENWTVVDDEVLAGSGYALEGVSEPCIIKDGDTYKMWHSQVKTDLTATELADLLANTGSLDADVLLDVLDATATVISYTTSDDGIDWAVPEEVLSEDTPLWDSVASPSVIKDGGDYQMWYTRIEADLTSSHLQNILDEIRALGLPDLLKSIDPEDLDEFLAELATLDTADLEAMLADTSTVIGYAESADGEDWLVADLQDITGSSSSLWSSVMASSVLKYGSIYKMWYTKGIDDLSVAELIDLLQGTKLPIGYAYYIPHPGGSPGGGGRDGNLTLEAIMDFTNGYYAISPEGRIQETIDITSEDELLNILIPKGTYALDEAGEPVTRLEFTADGTPPPLPQDAYIIGLAYHFKPNGTTFAPPITTSWRYNPDDVPPGIAEKDLVIAYHNEVSGAWVTLPSVVDTANNTISATAGHFSTFAVVAYSGTPPPPPAPAAFTTTSLSISPTTVNTGEPVTISVLATNIGEEAGIYTITLRINGTVEATQRIVLAGSASQTVSFTTSRYQVGSYSVDVNGIPGYFTVSAAATPPPTTPTPTPQPPAGPSRWLIGGILAAAVTAVTILLVLRRRRSQQ